MIVRDISKCRELWEKFSENSQLWDLWEIAASSYTEKNQTPYFIVLDSGLVPLWKDKDNTYEYFGGAYPENRKLWFNLESFEKVFNAIPEKTWIFDINGKQAEEIVLKNPEYAKYFEKKDKRYFLNLAEINHSLEEYLKRFNKKHRKNLLNDLKKLDHLHAKWGGMEYFEYMVKFNVSRFGKESDFYDPEFTETVMRFFEKMADMNLLKFLAIMDRDQVVGVEAAAVYKNKYYVLNGGYDTKIKNLGKLIIFKHIMKAIEIKADEIDFLVGDTGWKELWNLDSEICYTFIK